MLMDNMRRNKLLGLDLLETKERLMLKGLQAAVLLVILYNVGQFVLELLDR